MTSLFTRVHYMRRRLRHSNFAVGVPGLSANRLPWLLGLCSLSLVTLILVIVQNLDTDNSYGHANGERIATALHIRLPRSVNDTMRSMTAAEKDMNQQFVEDDNGVISSGYLELIPANSTMTSLAEIQAPRVKKVSYGDSVDLRLLVLAYNRPDSLQQCLDSLEAAFYEQSERVSLHVWIDGLTGDPNCSDHDHREMYERTLDVANRFNFTHGAYRVHVRDWHVGVQGQWMTVWRPPSTPTDVVDSTTREIALIVEDDISVSPFYWRWLKSAHEAYGKRDDVSGFSVSHPEIQHATGSTLEVPFRYTVFMYPVICTWGYSPKASSWSQFEDWFFSLNSTFQPLVDGVLTSEWFVGERRFGRERTLWEQWHIYFTHWRNQFTVIANPGSHVGLLAVNRHERGVHDGNTAVGATQPLAEQWSDRFESFPVDVVKLGFDGRPMG